MSSTSDLSRREFIGVTAAVAALAGLPRGAAAGAQPVPAGRRVRIAYIGCGTQGFRQLMQALPMPDVEIAVVCDPVRAADDYPDYGGDELNNRVRAFLNAPDWAKGAPGARCGREPARELVTRFYAAEAAAGRFGGPRAGCRAYADVHALLAQEPELDAVYVMTPDHLHGVIAVLAMRRGLHVITHKPIANVLGEVRLAREVARETGAATHVFCAAGSGAGPTLREWIDAGAIGPVREVHNWSTRPFWPQGMTEPPAGAPPVPDGFDWDLWVGPAAARPYHPAYTHAVFRGWYDFGTGALGDMGHYSFHQIFEALELGSPSAVEATRSQVWRMAGHTWQRATAHVAYPHASLVRWEFPARGERPPVALHWYDGGLKPPVFPELEQDGQALPEEGLLFVGDAGRLLAGFTGDDPRLIPQSRMRTFQPPAPSRPRPIGELEQFLRACRGGPPTDASFAAAYPYAETILLGTVALRVPGKLRWDAAAGRFANSEDANRLLTRVNRDGWAV